MEEWWNWCVSLVGLYEHFWIQTPKDDGASIIYIHNISPREARDLRATLTKISGVKNYLLLLNKVHACTHLSVQEFKCLVFLRKVPVCLICLWFYVFQVFIEFNTIYDADRLGVWYSLLKRGLIHTVSRLKMPRSKLTSERKGVSLQGSVHGALLVKFRIKFQIHSHIKPCYLQDLTMQWCSKYRALFCFTCHRFLCLGLWNALKHLEIICNVMDTS